MTIRSISLLSALIIAVPASSMAMSFDQGTVPAPSGDYRVVALRNASDVASMAGTDADLVEWIGRTVSFGETLQWIDGSSCDIWSAVEAEQFPLDLNDPNLSDLAIEPLSPPAYHVFAFAQAFDLYCDDSSSRHIGSIIRIDDRILVTQSASGSTNLILEKALSSMQVRRLQYRLWKKRFLGGQFTDRLDEATLKGIAHYAKYRGAEYRFLRTAITKNLLDGLGVLDDTEDLDESAFRDYRPKGGADTLRDYSPDFAMQIDDFPEVSFDNLANLLSRLKSLGSKASKMHGSWVDGNLALGANQMEYIPSYSEIMTAALGDRISAFVAATDPVVLARQWSQSPDPIVTYERFDIRHVDVMGSGRFFYSSAPITVAIKIPGTGL